MRGSRAYRRWAGRGSRSYKVIEMKEKDKKDKKEKVQDEEPKGYWQDLKNFR